MSLQIRSLTGLGATIALIGSLLSVGCGQGAKNLAPGLQRPGMARIGARGTYEQRFLRRPMLRPMRANVSAPKGLEGDDDAPTKDDPPATPAAPAAPAAPGGLAPLPKPTPVPAAKPPAGPPEPSSVDELYEILQNFGYGKTKKAMIATIKASTLGYPVHSAQTPGGWDPVVNPTEHYKWWKATLGDDIGGFEDYMAQSLQLAQNKFDVVYYVWVSKQMDPEEMKRQGRTSPFVDFNDEIPVVKAIEDGPWLVQIAPNATIHDYLKIPEAYLKDYNHLLEIPADLYF